MAKMHEYQLYLAINDIEHTKTKANHLQSNGICARCHKPILQDFYQLAFRRKIHRSIEDLQVDLDEWIDQLVQRAARASGKDVLLQDTDANADRDK